MRPAIAVTGLALLAATGCGEKPEPPAPAAIAVCDAVEGDVTGEEVAIEGEGTDLTKVDFGFALSDGGCSVFVDAPPKEALDVDTGDSVEVRGDVRALSGAQAERLRSALQRRPPKQATRAPEGLGLDRGDPFVDAYGLPST